MGNFNDINNSSFQTLFELSPSIIAVIDIENFTFNKINAAFVEILGYDRESLIGKSITEVNLFTDVLAMDKLIESIKNRECLRNFELEINTFNGTIHCKLYSDVLDKNTNEEYVIIIYNLTNQKSVEDELKNAEFKVMAIFDTLPIQAWIKNNAGVYLDVNKEFVRTWGKTIEQILGFTDKDIFPPQTAEQYLKKDKLVMESGERTYFEEIVENENGKFVYETYKTPTRNTNGEICGTFGISQDITNKKRIAAELVKAKENAEARSEAKSMFLANMSHEIRTPLNGLMGFLQLLDNTQLTQQQAEFVNNIKISSKLLKTVTDDILDVSKIQVKGIQLVNAPFDLCKTIEDAIIPLTANLYNKNLDINLFIRPDVPNYVLGDSTKLKQVISNIFNNAVKFTENGSIFVEVTLDNTNEKKYEISFKIK
ncbi:MAG TPA: PAS domain S-box protein, partial [Clostridiales bacterium]|nr:PAS domain S-box protein [Clostridiales bacterium]